MAAPSDTVPDSAGHVALLRAGAPRPLLSRTAEARLGPRHHEILEELEAMFMERGFAAFTIADLAAGVGCSRRTLYELAPSKDQLVHVVLDRFLHKKGRRALDAIDPAEPFDLQLRAYLAGGVEFELQSRLADDLADDAAARRIVDRHYRFVMTVVERLVSMGVEAGDFRPVNPAVVAATVTGTALYLSDPTIAADTGLDAATAVDQVLDLVLPSLTGAPT